MRKDNVKNTVMDGLCMGCGLCEDICPKHCIHIQKGRLNVPVVDDQSCVTCGLCRKVCAGKGIEIERLSKTYFGEIPHSNYYLGHYLNLYKGYSTDYDIRFHSASGGCVSQFLIWLLEKGEIDGAVVTGFKSDKPMEPRVYIARNRDEVLAGKSSKYCVVTMNGLAREIHETPGRYAVVGLPCHIHAFRKYCSVDKKVGERIIGFFPIFCSGNKNMDSQVYLKWRYNVDEKHLAEFAYRDEGCLGKMFFRDSDGNKIVEPVEYLHYYLGMRSFFGIPRCGVCSDFFGELGDVCFGDLNDGSKDDDPVGVSSIITRSKKWDALFRQCMEEGKLVLSDIDEDKMIYANRFVLKKKGPALYATMKMRKWLFKNNPEFDNLLAPAPKIPIRVYLDRKSVV